MVAVMTVQKYKQWLLSSAYNKWKDSHDSGEVECARVMKLDCIGHVQKRMGDLSVKCSSCAKATSLKTSSSVTNRGQSYRVNQRAVYHSLEKGGRYEGLVIL